MTAAMPYKPPPPKRFANVERGRTVMAELCLDALVGTTDYNLYYLSGHAPDSVLCHFVDSWGAAILPRAESAPPALITSDYDLAYLATHPTWMPEVRVYGAEWSGASALVKAFSRSDKSETELRVPIGALYARTRGTLVPDLIGAIARYVADHLPKVRIKIGFDDPRVAAAVRDKVGERLETFDALWAFRRIRHVKTPDEIEILRKAAHINDLGVRAASGAVAEGVSWRAMVNAFRETLARHAAKPCGERGMLFGAGPDGSMVLDHDYVDTKRFAPGDAVVLDAISQYRLYHADMARTAVVGEPHPRQAQIFKVVTEIVEAGEDAMRPGAHTRAIQLQATDTLKKHGLDPALCTLVVHPIGLDIFEFAAPDASVAGWTIEAGSALNFEVFYRDPQVGGLHIEDTVLVAGNGVERLTTLPRELIVRPASS